MFWMFVLIFKKPSTRFCSEIWNKSISKYFKKKKKKKKKKSKRDPLEIFKQISKIDPLQWRD